MKNFEYNVDTLYNMKFPKTTTSKEADIIDIKTKSKVDDKGIMQLKDDLGLPEGVSPKSPMGKNLQELKQVTKEVELKGKQLDKDIDTSLQDVVEGMFGPLGKKAGTDVMREGQRRAVIRQILLSDKNIKLPADKFDDLLYSRDLGKGTDAEDPLKLLDRYYERDMSKLDELDDIIDSTSGPIEAADTFLKKGGFRLKGKTPDDDIPFAQGGIAGQLHMNEGGRVGLQEGGLPTVESLDGVPNVTGGSIVYDLGNGEYIYQSSLGFEIVGRDGVYTSLGSGYDNLQDLLNSGTVLRNPNDPIRIAEEAESAKRMFELTKQQAAPTIAAPTTAAPTTAAPTPTRIQTTPGDKKVFNVMMDEKGNVQDDQSLLELFRKTGTAPQIGIGGPASINSMSDVFRLAGITGEDGISMGTDYSGTTLPSGGIANTLPVKQRMQAAAAKGLDPRMGRTYAENIQAMADPRMRGAKGGLAKILGV